MFGAANVHVLIPDDVQKPPVFSEEVLVPDQGKAYQKVEKALDKIAAAQVLHLPDLEAAEPVTKPTSLSTEAQIDALKEGAMAHILANPSLSEKQAYNLAVKLNKIDAGNELSVAMSDKPFITQPFTLREMMAWRDECRILFNGQANVPSISSCMAQNEEKRAIKNALEEDESNKLAFFTAFMGLIFGGGLIGALNTEFPKERYQNQLDQKRRNRRPN